MSVFAKICWQHVTALSALPTNTPNVNAVFGIIPLDLHLLISSVSSAANIYSFHIQPVSLHGSNISLTIMEHVNNIHVHVQCSVFISIAYWLLSMCCYVTRYLRKKNMKVSNMTWVIFSPLAFGFRVASVRRTGWSSGATWSSLEAWCQICKRRQLQMKRTTPTA